MIKLKCIDQQHADNAKLEFEYLKRKVVAYGKTVIAAGELDLDAEKIRVRALACVGAVTDWDVEYLGGES